VKSSIKKFDRINRIDMIFKTNPYPVNQKPSLAARRGFVLSVPGIRPCREEGWQTIHYLY
jgi:hypothetical protein